MQQRVLLQPAYLVHRRPYRDTSLLLEVFTEGYGRLGLVAKGARRPKSALRGLLQSFSPLLISWSGRGELPTLIAVERDGSGMTLGGKALLCGLYLNELMMRLTHRHDAHSRLFAYYSAALSGLASEADTQWVLRRFEKGLLEDIGYGLILDRDAESGETLDPDQRYVYFPDRGPVRADAVSTDEPLISGRSLLALARDDGMDLGVARDAKRLMRSVLAFHLDGKPLKSRTLFRADVNAMLDGPRNPTEKQGTDSQWP